MLRKVHNSSRIYLNKIRTLYWRHILRQFGERSRVLGSIVIYHPQSIVVGDHVTLNEGVIINARAPITIGSHVHVSPRVIINGGGLDYSQIMDKRTHIAKPITIEDGVWIGSGAIINPGVTIGKNAVIAAGAVVTRNISANMVAAGVPAREIKKIENGDSTLRAEGDRTNREG